MYEWLTPYHGELQLLCLNQDKVIMLKTSRINKQTLCSLHFMILHARSLQLFPVKITCRSLEAVVPKPQPQPNNNNNHHHHHHDDGNDNDNDNNKTASAAQTTAASWHLSQNSFQSIIFRAFPSLLRYELQEGRNPAQKQCRRPQNPMAYETRSFHR